MTTSDQPSRMRSGVWVKVARVLLQDLQGRRNGTLTIEIVGVDNDLPTITVTSAPVANTTRWNNSDVTRHIRVLRGDVWRGELAYATLRGCVGRPAPRFTFASKRVIDALSFLSDPEQP